jgi:hypothetical protein
MNPEILGAVVGLGVSAALYVLNRTLPREDSQTTANVEKQDEENCISKESTKHEVDASRTSWQSEYSNAYSVEPYDVESSSYTTTYPHSHGGISLSSSNCETSSTSSDISSSDISSSDISSSDSLAGYTESDYAGIVPNDELFSASYDPTSKDDTNTPPPSPVPEEELSDLCLQSLFGPEEPEQDETNNTQQDDGGTDIC